MRNCATRNARASSRLFWKTDQLRSAAFCHPEYAAARAHQFSSKRCRSCAESITPIFGKNGEKAIENDPHRPLTGAEYSCGPRSLAALVKRMRTSAFERTFLSIKVFISETSTALAALPISSSRPCPYMPISCLAEANHARARQTSIPIGAGNTTASYG